MKKEKEKNLNLFCYVLAKYIFCIGQACCWDNYPCSLGCQSDQLIGYMKQKLINFATKYEKSGKFPLNGEFCFLFKMKRRKNLFGEKLGKYHNFLYVLWFLHKNNSHFLNISHVPLATFCRSNMELEKLTTAEEKKLKPRRG